MPSHTLLGNSFPRIIPSWYPLVRHLKRNYHIEEADGLYKQVMWFPKKEILMAYISNHGIAFGKELLKKEILMDYISN